MSYLKKRLAVFLCMLVAFTAIFVAAPQENVQAATTVSFIWRYGSSNGVQVAKGASNFYIGDYVSAYSYGSAYQSYGYLSLNKGVTYTSSNSSVLTVNKTTGKAIAKKTGTATVTVKFKSATTTMKFQVVSKVNYTSTNLAASKKVATTFVKAYGTGITTKNRYSVLSAYKAYNTIGGSGMSYIYQNNTSQSVIYDTTVGHAYALADAVRSYGEEKSPFSTSQGKYFAVKSVTGTKKTVTVTLKSSVTADQIFGIQYAASWDTKVASAKKVSFPIYVVTPSNGHRYYAEATATQGSKKLTIQTRNLTLKKGTTYSLYCPNYAWLEKVNTNFKAK